MNISFKQNINMENFALAAKNNRAHSAIHKNPPVKNAETFMPNGSIIRGHAKNNAKIKKAEFAIIIGILAAALFAPQAIKTIKAAMAGKNAKKLAGEARAMTNIAKNKITKVSELYLKKADKTPDGRTITRRHKTMREFAADGHTVLRKSIFENGLPKYIEETLPDGKINTIQCSGGFILYQEGIERISLNDTKISRQVLLADNGTIKYRKGIFKTIKNNKPFRITDEEIIQKAENEMPLSYKKKFDGAKWVKEYFRSNNGKQMFLYDNVDPNTEDVINSSCFNEAGLDVANSIAEFLTDLSGLEV